MIYCKFESHYLSIHAYEIEEKFVIEINKVEGNLNNDKLPDHLQEKIEDFFDEINLKSHLKINTKFIYEVDKNNHIFIDKDQLANRNYYTNLNLDKGKFLLPYSVEPTLPKEVLNFQKFGIDWLLNKSGAILADDMGLGKTVQAIFATKLALNRKRLKTVLVLCPKSLIKNWVREFNKWCPEIPTLELTPPEKIKNYAWKICVNKFNVIISNYDSFRELPLFFKENQIDILICDESHRLRKSTSQINNSIRNINSKHLWMLTGSPVEKDAKDLATLLSLIKPQLYTSSPTKDQFKEYIITSKDYILRRLKNDILKELPKVHKDKSIKIKLSEHQKSNYDELLFNARNNKSEYEILPLLNNLLSICNFDPITKESSKIDQILNELKKIRNSNEKAVVFSYLIEPLKVLKKKLDKFGLKSVFYDGSLDINEREEILNEFKTNDDITTFLCSMRAGGEGLTLTEANHVLFLNRWWNPSTNNQAQDRVIRIGQKKEVFVKHYVSEGTLEENLSNILDEKEKIYIQSIEKNYVKEINQVNENNILFETATQLKLI